MFKNYFIIAWRNLIRNKTFSVLNILGLSVSFGVAVLLCLAALFELSYDSFHENVDDMYQLYSSEQFVKGPEVSLSNPEPMAQVVKNEIPGVHDAVRYLDDSALLVKGENNFTLDGAWVDPGFFSMFTFPVAEGNPQPLAEKSHVAITKAAAKNVFGDAKVLGKTIQLLIDGEQKSFEITSILEDLPENSSLGFELVINFENHVEYENSLGQWNQKYHEVYVQLEPNMSPATFHKNSAEVMKKYLGDSIENTISQGTPPDADGNYVSLRLLPMSDRESMMVKDGLVTANHNMVYLLFGVAFLILIIACVNFTNMSIAKSVQRLKEIGMRKTLGAPKKQLFVQLWCESLIIFLISALLGIILGRICLDTFNTIFRTQVSLDQFASIPVLLGFVFFVLLITFLSGGYPAMIMSRMGTIQALKGKWDSNGKNRLRNALIVVQFCISILFISGTLILWQQTNYMKNKDLGFNKDFVISVPLSGNASSYEFVELFRNELINQPGILSVSGADDNLGYGEDGSISKSVMGFDHKGKNVKTNVLTVDADYVKTLDINLLEGRSFDATRAADSLAFIVNESMAKDLGEERPLEATIMLDSTPFKIIGVVEDYHFEELNKSIEPITLIMNPTWGLYYAYVKVAPQNLTNSYDFIEKTWNRLQPGTEFRGSFLNENVDRTFRKERALTTMITSGSVIAILLSCIGLFAISLLVVSQRTKEIGIRRVIGASVTSITYLLTKDFLKLVAIGFVIATPFAKWLADAWLEDYAYRIQLSLWLFLLPGLIALSVALITIGGKTISAARQNPTKSLRTE